jgi:hypothetical protein
MRLLSLLLALAAAAAGEEDRIATLVRWYLREPRPSRQEDLVELIEQAAGRDPARVAAAIAAGPAKRGLPALGTTEALPSFDVERPHLLDAAAWAGNFARLTPPAGYDPARAWPLVIDLLSPTLPPAPDALHLRIDVSRIPGAAAVESLLLSLVALLVEEANADPGRVYLRAQGDAAPLAWYIALYNPDRFAGLFAAQGMWGDSGGLAANARSLRILAVEKRRGEPELRALFERLRADNPAHALLSAPPDASEDGAILGAMEEWRAGAPRPPPPPRIVLALERPFALRSYWLRVAPQVRSEQRTAVGTWSARGMRRSARIDATIGQENLVRVRTESVAAFDLFVDPGLFDLERPLRVSINGGVPEARLLSPSIGEMLADYRERRDPRLLSVQRLTFSVPGR